MMIRRFVIVSLVLAAGTGCGDGGPGDAPPATARPVPTVSDARQDLVLTWYGDGGPAVAASVAEVPQEARREVRVQDPSIPPEARDPDVVFLADLTRPNADGSYPVRAVPRADYEKRESHLAEKGPPRADAVGPTAAPSGGAPVVMYATKTCPVCKTARRWLLESGVPYVEKDVDSDQAAAAELAQKGRAQGVSTSGVPIFEVRGRLIPGFDPGAIQAALSGAAPAPAPTPLPAPAAPSIPIPAPAPAQQTI
jgi:glutaredoxin